MRLSILEVEPPSDISGRVFSMRLLSEEPSPLPYVADVQPPKVGQVEHTLCLTPNKTKELTVPLPISCSIDVGLC